MIHSMDSLIDSLTQMILCQNDSVIQKCHQLFTCCITVTRSDSSVCLVQLHIAASKITYFVY